MEKQEILVLNINENNLRIILLWVFPIPPISNTAPTVHNPLNTPHAHIKSVEESMTLRIRNQSQQLTFILPVTGIWKSDPISNNEFQFVLPADFFWKKISWGMASSKEQTTPSTWSKKTTINILNALYLLKLVLQTDTRIKLHYGTRS